MIAVPTLFSDVARQNRFDRDGFVVIDFLGADEVKTLHNVATAEAVHGNQPFYSSIFSHDGAYRERVSEPVCTAFADPISRAFANADQIYGGFMTKMPLPQSFIGFHQDWTIVDEEQHQAAGIWCALGDVDETNGCLLVVPGSHRLPSAPRGFNSGFPYDPLIPELLRAHTIRVPMRAGQAMIFSQRLFHGSNPNTVAGRLRLCAHGIVAPRDAQVQHYVAGGMVAPHGSIARFDVERAFYRSTFRWGVAPDAANYRGDVRDECKVASAAELRELLPAINGVTVEP